MVFFPANRRPVLAIERDIKNTGAELLRQFGLQGQAFDHARLHATIVVAHR